MAGLLARFRRPAATPETVVTVEPDIGFADLFDTAPVHSEATPREAPPADPADEAAALATRVQSLRQSGDLEAAIAAAEAGLARYPEAGPLLVEHAFNAAEAGASQVAVARWAAVRARMPLNSIGYAGGFNALNRLGAFEEAAAVLAAGLALMPQDRSLLSSTARQACRRQDWAEAERLWTLLAELCPDDVGLLLEGARLMMGRRFDRATRRPFILHQLGLAQTRFPADPAPCALQLYVLRDAGALARAAEFGAACRARFPQDAGLATSCAEIEGQSGRPADGLAMLGCVASASAAVDAARVRLLCQAERQEEAERICAAALKLHAPDAALIEQHVTLATRRGDFAEAARRCAAGRAALPDDAGLLAMAQRISLLTQEGLAEDAPAVEGLAALFARCESLGGTRFGCEFGMVQRRFNADPIGLLRWANISLAGLAAGITAGFEGLDNADETIMETRATAQGEREYFLVNRRYEYFAHTFIRIAEAPADRVYAQALRRLRFLSAKLMEDLAAAEKVFVFKMPDYAGADAARPVLNAMRHRGPATLLCVALADAGHAAGDLERVAPGLLVGRVSMFTNAGSTGQRGMDFEGWHRLVALSLTRP